MMIASCSRRSEGAIGVGRTRDSRCANLARSRREPGKSPRHSAGWQRQGKASAAHGDAGTGPPDGAPLEHLGRAPGAGDSPRSAAFRPRRSDRSTSAMLAFCSLCHVALFVIVDPRFGVIVSVRRSKPARCSGWESLRSGVRCRRSARPGKGHVRVAGKADRRGAHVPRPSDPRQPQDVARADHGHGGRNGRIRDASAR
jgi:hypothetical protein